MTSQERIEEALHRLEIYVSEHGQVFGTVSRQMALDSVKTLRDEFQVASQTRESCARIANAAADRLISRTWTCQVDRGIVLIYGRVVQRKNSDLISR